MGQLSTGHFDGLSMAGIAPGSGAGSILRITGAPGAGTDETQTLTIGGTPTGGTFRLAFESEITAPITWSATTVTLLANINAALVALVTIGAGDLIATDVDLGGTGIGNILLTFGANRAKQAVDLVTVHSNNLTGTSPTLAIVQTQAGVDAAFRGWPIGQMVVNVSNGDVYSNTGTSVAPTWTKQT